MAPQGDTYLLYPRINETVCEAHHDAVGPTLAARLLAAAVSVGGRGGRRAWVRTGNMPGSLSRHTRSAGSSASAVERLA
jgi:hypothetical protein